MKGYTWKVAIILAVLVLSVWAMLDKPLRLGIDLRGGAELLFRIDTEGLDQSRLTNVTENTVEIIRRRVDPSSQRGMIIQTRDRNRILMQLPGFSREETEQVVALATNLGRLEWRLVAEPQDPVKIANLKAGRSVPGFAWYPMSDEARKNDPEGALPEGYMVVVGAGDPYNITGELLQTTFVSSDEMGRPAVSFQMKPEGAKRFSRMTGEHVDDQIAIILNNKIFSAPFVKERITGDGVITGMDNLEEAKTLVTVLNSGSLEAPLVLESEYYVGPTLGLTTIESAINAGIWSAIVVVAFMAAYYFFAGAVADLAMALNILILLAVMKLSNATLTLPGIAGIILTMGMAVDANVLIFERIREERRLGRELPVALRLGYEKAFSAIFDSNLTTFATAAILYYVGTGPVKGFAVTLSMGILISFFTAVFVTRVVFELLARQGLLKDMKMMHLLTRTNIPFLSYARWWIAISLIVNIIGMVLFVQRGRDNLDIDFTGGTWARLELTRPLPLDEVQKRLGDAGYPDVLPQAVAKPTEGEAEVGGAAKSYAIRTQLTGEDIAGFENKIAEAFADVVASRPLKVEVRGAAAITARNDPFFGGVRIEAALEEAMPAGRILEQLAAAGLPKYEAELSTVDRASGEPVKAGPDEKAVTRITVTAAGAPEQEIKDKLTAALTVPNPFPEEISQIGGEVARELAGSAVLAVMLAMGFIIVYIWFRFGRLSYGVASVIALLHDVLITLSALAIGDALGAIPALRQTLLLGDMKINLAVVGAILTIVGYSLNDTIVVFDRIRENMRLKTKSDWDIINGSINQTLSRTMLTGLTTIFVIIIMYVIGGPGIHTFAFVMLVGVVVGTYSSVFIATPILLIKDVLRGRPIEQGNAK